MIAKSRIEASDQNGVVDLRFDGLDAQSFPCKPLAVFLAPWNKALFNFGSAIRSIGNLMHVTPGAVWTRTDQTNFSIDVTTIETPGLPRPLVPHYLVNASGGRR